MAITPNMRAPIRASVSRAPQKEGLLQKLAGFFKAPPPPKTTPKGQDAFTKTPYSIASARNLNSVVGGRIVRVGDRNLPPDNQILGFLDQIRSDAIRIS